MYYIGLVAVALFSSLVGLLLAASILSTVSNIFTGKLHRPVEQVVSALAYFLAGILVGGVLVLYLRG